MDRAFVKLYSTHTLMIHSTLSTEGAPHEGRSAVSRDDRADPALRSRTPSPFGPSSGVTPSLITSRVPVHSPSLVIPSSSPGLGDDSMAVDALDGSSNGQPSLGVVAPPPDASAPAMAPVDVATPPQAAPTPPAPRVVAPLPAAAALLDALDDSSTAEARTCPQAPRLLVGFECWRT